MITIETADRPGLLVDIAKVFFKKDMSIFSSRINTLGDKVEDTFEINGAIPSITKFLLPPSELASPGSGRDNEAILLDASYIEPLFKASALVLV